MTGGHTSTREHARHIKDTINIRDVVRRYLGHPEKSTQAYDVYYSPFRDDGRKPAFTVYEDQAHDFVTGESISVIDFIMQIDNRSLSEACEILDPQHGSYSSPSNQVIRQRREKRQTKRQAIPAPAWQQAVSAYCDIAHRRLMRTPHMLNYLRDERGLTDDTIRHFKLGYNPTWTDLDFRHEGKTVKVAPGITLPWYADNILYAVRVRTFSDKLDKYMSVSGSKPGAGFFNADPISDGQALYMTEGEFDAMLLWQETGAAVVTRGSAGDCSRIPERWLPHLQKASQIYTLFDDDSAGQNATEKLATRLPIAPLSLPVGNDVTEFFVSHQGQWIDVNHEVAILSPAIWTEDVSAPPETDDGYLVWLAEQFPDHETAVQGSADSSGLPIVQDIPLSGAKHISVQYLSEHMDCIDVKTCLIQSPMGTGKTHAVIELIKQLNLKRILFVTHRKNLIRDIVRRLRDAGIDAEYYDSILERSWRRAVDVMVICVDSITQLEGATPYDLVVIDEIEQVIAHIAHAGTMGNDAQFVMQTLYHILKAAGRVVALDAHASDISLEYLQHSRDDVYTVKNTYRPTWGKLHIAPDKATVVYHARQCADNNPDAPVIITTNHRWQARLLEAYFARLYGIDKVRAIHGWNSNHQDTLEFCENLNENIKGYRVLIVSPSVGTGIDIQTPVAGVFGLFFSEPTLPTDMLQQMGRWRNARQRMAYVTDVQRSLTTNAEKLYQTIFNGAKRTEQQAGMDDISKWISTHARLRAGVIAAGNCQKQHLRGTFMALAQHEGYEVEVMPSAPPLKDNPLVRLLMQYRGVLQVSQALSTDALSLPAIIARRILSRVLNRLRMCIKWLVSSISMPRLMMFLSSLIAQQQIIEAIEQEAEALKLAGQELADRDKAIVLTDPALPGEELRYREMAGTVIVADYLSNLRYNIEQDTGHHIDERHYDAYRSKRKRRRLARYTDWRFYAAMLPERDRAEFGSLLHRRRHHTRAGKTIRDVLLRRVLTAWRERNFARLHCAELRTMLQPIIDELLPRIQSIEGRMDLSEDVISIFRRWLPGSVLKSIQVSNDGNGQRGMMYWLDEDALRIFWVDTEIRYRYRESVAKNPDTPLYDIQDFSDDALIAAGLTPISDPIGLLCEMCGVSGALSPPD